MSDGYDRIVAQETLTTDITEELSKVLREQGLTLQDLALRTGKSQVLVTRMFSGEKDMKLSDVADFASALGYRFQLELQERRKEET